MPWLENGHRGLHLSRGAPCRIAIFGLWVAVFTFATSWLKSAAMPYVFGAVFVASIGLGLRARFLDLEKPQSSLPLTKYDNEGVEGLNCDP
jgi:hypothetical protein